MSSGDRCEIGLAWELEELCGRVALGALVDIGRSWNESGLYEI